MNKKIILPIIIIIVILLVVFKTFSKKGKAKIELVEVQRGTVLEEISATGQVKKGEPINISFKQDGKIKKIYIQVGDQVKTGSLLAELETDQLTIKLNDAKANLEVAQAKLDKLLAGATPQEIQVAQTKVVNAQTSLASWQQILSDTKTQGEDNLASAYEDALNTLDDSYLKIQNSFNKVDSIQRTYFTSGDQASLKVLESKNLIAGFITDLEPIIDKAKFSSNRDDTDSALSKMKIALSEVNNALNTIRNVCDETNYQNTVTQTDKDALDTQKGYILTALTNTANAQQTIASTKATNAVNLNTAQNKVDTAQGSLNSAQDELKELLAPPRQEDVNLYQSQVSQAESQLQLLESQLRESVIKSPVDGQIVEVKKRVGEIVQPTAQDVAIIILPSIPFEIEVDIYEEDVVKIKIGNPVDISLVAFPDQKFDGKVVSIDPAEKLIDGVVYYKTVVAFEKMPEGIKPGMTADLIIKTASKENVLIVPEEALQEKEGKTIVQVARNGNGKNVENREVEVGLKGSNYQVEIISGLKEGEKVVLP